MFGATLDIVENCADGRAALAASEFDALVARSDAARRLWPGLARRTCGPSGDRTPVLLLTALDEIADRIKGLDAGADDYLGKPFDLDELGARLRAIGRRQAGRASPLFSCNGIVLDPAHMSAVANGQAGRPVAPRVRGA